MIGDVVSMGVKCILIHQRLQKNVAHRTFGSAEHKHDRCRCPKQMFPKMNPDRYSRARRVRVIKKSYCGGKVNYDDTS